MRIVAVLRVLSRFTPSIGGAAQRRSFETGPSALAQIRGDPGSIGQLLQDDERLELERLYAEIDRFSLTFKRAGLGRSERL